MGDAKAGPFGEVEGDYSVVKVQLAGGNKEEKPKRPTKGTQVVWGGTDPYLSTRFAHLYADALGGDARVDIVDGAGHWPWLERPEVVDRVADFLSG